MGAVVSFSLTIPGKPHGQGRARHGRGFTYTPAETRAHAQRIQTEWIAAGRPTLPAGAHYSVSVTSWRARPASHRTTKGGLSAAGRRQPFPGKPDCDNELKAVLDALVACGAIPDDRLCWAMGASKRWLTDDRPERVVISVTAEAAREEAA